MGNEEQIKAIASAIAANAKMIADNPSDWPDNIRNRIHLIKEDLERLNRLTRG